MVAKEIEGGRGRSRAGEGGRGRARAGRVACSQCARDSSRSPAPSPRATICRPSPPTLSRHGAGTRKHSSEFGAEQGLQPGAGAPAPAELERAQAGQRARRRCDRIVRRRAPQPQHTQRTHAAAALTDALTTAILTAATSTLAGIAAAEELAQPDRRGGLDLVAAEVERVQPAQPLQRHHLARLP